MCSIKGMNMNRTMFENAGLCILIILLWFELVIAKSAIKEVNGFVKVRTRAGRSSVLSQRVYLNNNEKERIVEVKELKTPTDSIMPSQLEDKDITMFTSFDGSLLCMQVRESPLQEEDPGTIRCKEDNGQISTYFTEERALEVELDEDSFHSMYDVATDKIFNRRTTADTAQRNRRQVHKPRLSITEGIIDGVIKLKYFVDASIMAKFQYLVVGNNTVLKDEVACFIYMSNTQVNMYTLTLSDWNKKFTTADSVTYPLRFLVYVHSIEFPAEVNGVFDDPPAIKNNLIGNTLVYNSYYDSYGTFLGINGVLYDFAVHMKQQYAASDDFNLVVALTGYDIAEYKWVYNSATGYYDLDDIKYNTIGVAFLYQLCQNYQSSSFDLRFSLNEIHAGYYAKVLAHEIGHNIGSTHDESTECPSNAYTIMAPSALPRLRENPKYSKFSICSAREIADYLSGFTSSDIAACLYTESPTEAEFLAKFCKGLVGFKFNLNQTCQIFFGGDSFACTNGSDYLPPDKCQTERDGYGNIVPVFYCSQDMSCNNTGNVITHPFSGTKCLDDSGNSFCFNGTCREDTDLC